MEPPTILTASNVLEHLIMAPPQFFNQTFLSSSLDIPLNPLISLYAQGSVLDAMQVMSLNNLSALGVLGESATRHRRTSSSSSSSRHVRVGSSSSFKPPSRSGSQVFNISPSILPVSPGLELPSPFDSGGGELMSIITAEGCGRLVVPSQGREALGMGLGEATKSLQIIEHAGQARGEERVPGAFLPVLLFCSSHILIYLLDGTVQKKLTSSPHNHLSFLNPPRLPSHPSNFLIKSISSKSKYGSIPLTLPLHPFSTITLHPDLFTFALRPIPRTGKGIVGITTSTTDRL
jgi:CBS domain-containing protein